MAVQKVTAGGGVLYRTEEKQPYILMIYRRGVWDLPKGKKEEEESIEACAVREVSEEVGCPLPDNLGKLTETYHEYPEGNMKMGKTTHWYVMRTNITEGFRPEREEGIEEVKWFRPTEAKQLAGYENLVRVIESFERWLKGSK